MNFPENGFYIHYKHNPKNGVHDHMYEVVGIARNTEEKTYSVLYRPLYENDWFAPASYQARPLDMFLETVEVNGTIKPRFEKVTDKNLISELEDARRNLYAAQDVLLTRKSRIRS